MGDLEWLSLGDPGRLSFAAPVTQSGATAPDPCDKRIADLEEARAWRKRADWAEDHHHSGLALLAPRRA
jgi:hypothetical protein